MKDQRKVFVAFSIIFVFALLIVFQYTIFLKKQNNLLMANVDIIKEQIISFESKNNIERWNAKFAELTKENDELRNKIAVLEAILAQEAAKTSSVKPKEAPKGNRGFLFKKR